MMELFLYLCIIFFYRDNMSRNSKLGKKETMIHFSLQIKAMRALRTEEDHKLFHVELVIAQSYHV